MNFYSQVSQAFQSAYLWVRGRFSRPVVELVPIVEAPKQIIPMVESIPKKRKTKQERPNVQTLAGVLENIESTFETFSIPALPATWLTKQEIAAIRKLGVYVPDDLRIEGSGFAKLDPESLFPAMASAALIPKSRDTDEKFAEPRFAFAIREPKLPPKVAKVEGIPYRFGYAYELGRGKSKRKIHWVWAYIVIRPDGYLVAPPELRSITRNVIHRKSGGAEIRTIHQSQWVKPAMMQLLSESDLKDTGRINEVEQYTLDAFKALMNWWMTREQRWSVSVSKDDKRVVFSVDPSQTAGYFADRQKVVAVDGKAKRIIHHVDAHTRVNGQFVKEHIRGLREFTWHGAKCIVTAPKFNGILATNCPVPPEYYDEDEKGRDLIGIDNLSDQLAAFEDGKIKTIKERVNA